MAEFSPTDRPAIETQIISAVKDSDKKKLKQLLTAADQHLTGKAEGDFREADGVTPGIDGKIAGFFDELENKGEVETAFYLGDGGCTRINIWADEIETGVGLSFSYDNEADDPTVAKIRQKWTELGLNNKS